MNPARRLRRRRVIDWIIWRQGGRSVVRVRCEQGSDLGELFAAQEFSFDGQVAALVIGEQDSPFTELLYQDSALGFEIVDPSLLLSVAPIRNDQQEQLPRL